VRRGGCRAAVVPAVPDADGRGHPLVSV
jgi:hypothetical protein